MNVPRCFASTANVYKDLQGVNREIRVRGFWIYEDCPLPKIPVILKSPHSHFHFNICGEFYFTGILWGYPTLVVRKSECGDFKFMGIACYPKIPVILKSPHSHFHCNICGEFDFTGILWGYPTLVHSPCWSIYLPRPFWWNLMSPNMEKKRANRLQTTYMPSTTLVSLSILAGSPWRTKECITEYPACKLTFMMSEKSVFRLQCWLSWPWILSTYHTV